MPKHVPTTTLSTFAEPTNGVTAAKTVTLTEWERKVHRCISAILDWNRKKSWRNFQQLRRECYIRHRSEPKVWHSVYTLVRTTWKVLTGKYSRCEAKWHTDGTLKYYGFEGTF